MDESRIKNEKHFEISIKCSILIINKAKYIEHIKDLKNKYVNSNVKVNIIDDSVIEKLSTASFDTNIDKYIQQNMPIHLTEKYENVKHKIEENKKWG